MNAAELNRLRPVIVMGGPGAERDVSLNSGRAVATALSAEGVEARPVEVHKSTGEEIPDDTGLVFNLIHGTFGEDGQLQAILDERGIPYTGEGAAASHLAFDKILTKERFDSQGVPTCRWKVLHRGDPLPSLPCVLKSPRQGSSVGVHIVDTPQAANAALDDCLQYGDKVLYEEFFSGRELTVGVLGEKVLPIVEIVPKDGFYDYEHKYTKGASEYFVPASIGGEATYSVQQAARQATKALGLKVYSRVDILLAADGRLNVMEVNTIPGMTATSLLPKSAQAAGIPFGELCIRIAELSLACRKKGGSR